MKTLRCVWIGGFLVVAGLFCHAATFSGQVKDSSNAPLGNVQVIIPALQKGTQTDSSGHFKLENVPHGIYSVEFQPVGYPSVTKQVDLSKGDATLELALGGSPAELAPITITAKPQPSQALTAPQSVSVLEGRQVDRLRGQNVTEAVQNLPGVSALTTGPYVAKPIIRGLFGQRVVIVADGSRNEVQQWGDEHGPEINTLTVDRYEVLRGPNSLIYGSDALGGVLAITTKELPNAALGDGPLGGRATLDGFSGHQAASGNLSLAGAAGIFGYRGNVTTRQAGNTRTPRGVTSNSGMKEVNGGARVGAHQEWGSMDLDYQRFNQRLELPSSDPAESSYQKLTLDTIRLRTHIPSSLARFEIMGGYQQNRRKEFAAITSPDADLHLQEQTSTVDLRAHHAPIGPVTGTIGMSAIRKTNITKGVSPLIPDFRSFGIGGYGYEELPVGPVTFSAGLRGDGAQLRADDNSTLNIQAQTRKWSAISGAFGAVYHVTEPFALAANFGRGFRAPIAFELFSNGKHEGTGHFDMGEPSLVPETNNNVDVAARYASRRFRGELTFFRNRIQHYIFENPTGTTSPPDPDTGVGLPVFKFAQTDATLQGSELALEADATDWLLFNAGYDLVRGDNDTLHAPLPRIPADRLKFGAQVHSRSLGQFENPYFGVGATLVDAQSRLADFELQSGSYALWNLLTGVDIALWGNRITVDAGVTNLFDKAYFDHLSRNAIFGILNPGRSVFLKLSVPFGGEGKG